MNESISRLRLFRFPFISGFILIVAAFILLHSVRAFADSTDGYEYEYERTDVPLSGIQRGQKLGTMYLKQQAMTMWREVDTTLSAAPLDVNIYAYNTIAAGGNPGCKLSGNDSSIGLLRFTGTTTETVCNYYVNNYAILKGIKAYATHQSKFMDGKYWYAFTMSVPRTKIADVVINDPDVALTHAGQTVLLSSLPYLYPTSSYTTAQIYARTPLSVPIGETHPAVFFPQQTTSHAVMPVNITSSGDIAAGSASLDMCLYDGVGLSDSHYMLLFSDENSSAGQDFSLRWKKGAGEISYSVSVTDPSGTPRTVVNGKPFYWSNMRNGGAAQRRAGAAEIGSINEWHPGYRSLRALSCQRGSPACPVQQPEGGRLHRQN